MKVLRETIDARSDAIFSLPAEAAAGLKQAGAVALRGFDGIRGLTTAS